MMFLYENLKFYAILSHLKQAKRLTVQKNSPKRSYFDHSLLNILTLFVRPGHWVIFLQALLQSLIHFSKKKNDWLQWLCMVSLENSTGFF